MGDVEKRGPLLRKVINETLGVKFGPWDMRKFLYECIDGRRARDIVESVNIKC